MVAPSGTVKVWRIPKLGDDTAVRIEGRLTCWQRAANTRFITGGGHPNRRNPVAKQATDEAIYPRRRQNNCLSCSD